MTPLEFIAARSHRQHWARALRDECSDSGIPLFVKQLGSNPLDGESGAEECQVPLKLADRKGGDIAEFPESLQVREFPNGS